MHKPTALVLTPFLFATLACTAHELTTPTPSPGAAETGSVALSGAYELDLLFVIDNSGSMREEQKNLGDRISALLEELEKLPGGLPSLHMAVVSSDLGAGSTFIQGQTACNRPGGDRGIFHAPDSCGLDPGQRFIIARDKGTQTNFDGELSDVFACMANLGTNGCGYEQPLAAAVAALDARNTANAGFLRDDATLAIIFVTDEDDCSAPADSALFVDPSFSGQEASLRCALVGHRCDGKALPAGGFQSNLASCEADDGPGRLYRVDDLVQAIAALKPNAPHKIVASAIMGWPGPNDARTYAIAANDKGLLDLVPACTSAFNGTATPGLRLKGFVEGFGPNGVVESICADDFSPALAKIGRIIPIHLTFCAGNLFDADPTTAGVQPECSVQRRQRDRESGQDVGAAAIPPCTRPDEAGCYEVRPADSGGNACPKGEHEIVLAPDKLPPGDYTVSCRKCVFADAEGCGP